MITDLLLESDTRDLDGRGVWPGGALVCGRPAQFGEVWLRQRADERIDILQADPVVLMTAEFVARVSVLDPRLMLAERGLQPGTRVTFYGVGREQSYTVVAYHSGIRVWLLLAD